MPKANSKTRTVGRNSKNGRFVTEDYVKKHPNTTETETIKNTPKNKPSSGKKK
jgi:hypothetical protein